MKTNYFLKSFIAMLFVFFVTSLSAKEITVKDNGTDSDLKAALDQAETGDTILIKGAVLFEAPVTVEKNVEFLGDGDLAYFDGQGKTKIFEINPEAIDEQTGLTFENLGFTGGENTDDGGIGRIIGGNTEFVNCWFEDNHTANRGGAFFIANENTNVRFNGCDADHNVADKTGGFVYATGAVSIEYSYCRITANSAPYDRGGAFYLEGGDQRFYYTLVEGNTSGVDGEGGERGGAGITTAGAIKTVTMESCAVTRNIAYGNHGASFFLMGNPNLTLINTTVAGNQTKNGAGGWFLPTDNIDITLVNVTMVNNTGTNSGNGGGGIRVMNPGNRVNIFNSIIASNICNNDEGAVDIRFDDKPNIEKDFVFKNSIVGLISGLPSDRIPAAQDNPNIANQSLIDMYRLAEESAQPDYVSLDVSGVDYIDGLTTTRSFKLPYYTLTDNTVYAAKLGDPALLKDQDADTDQLLVKRTTAADGTIFAGSVQSVTGGAAYNDAGWEENVSPIYYPFSPCTDCTGLIAPAIVAKGISIIGTPSNGVLGVDFGDLKGHATGTLVSITGQEVEKVFNLNVNSKGYYNIHVAPGMYILKVDIDGKTFAQKLIVTK